ncbi:MAG: GNAT family N-acetyltransferase [Xanthobacteraceae bacterium]|nr:GNAT family N-acetyltransferase [Xanthobacteraceae bacterium]
MSDPVVIDQRRMDCASVQDARDVVRATQLAIEFTVHHQLGEVEREWRAFERGADCTAFQSFDWLAAWCHHVGPVSRAQPAIVVGRQAGAVLFILPLAVTPGAIRRLTWFASDLCDYNGPLLAAACASQLTPERFCDLWREIRRRLQSDARTRHDLVELSKMPDRVGGQGGQPNPFMALATNLNPSNAYVTDLSGTWTEYYEAKRSSSTRRRDRSKLKRLGEIGPVRFVTPLDRGEIERSVDTLIEQKSRSFARMGVANMFDRPGWSAFFTAVATDERTRGLVHVSRLDVGSGWAAINLGLTFRDTYYHVLASYDDGETSRFGAGVAHLRDLLRYSIEHGLKHFDFTIGDERYKREWSDRTVTLYDHVAAGSTRGVPVAAMVLGHRRLKRFIKQNEALWSLFSRVRAAIGLKSAAAAAAADDAPETVRKSPPIAPQ